LYDSGDNSISAARGISDRKWRHYSILWPGFLLGLNRHIPFASSRFKVIICRLVSNGGKSISDARWHHRAKLTSLYDLLITVSYLCSMHVSLKSRTVKKLSLIFDWHVMAYIENETNFTIWFSNPDFVWFVVHWNYSSISYRSKVIPMYQFGILAWLEIRHSGLKLGYGGFPTPKCNFLSTPPSKDTSLAQTVSLAHDIFWGHPSK
jgi:hypothetical protein